MSFLEIFTSKAVKYKIYLVFRSHRFCTPLNSQYRAKMKVSDLFSYGLSPFYISLMLYEFYGIFFKIETIPFLLVKWGSDSFPWKSMVEINMIIDEKTCKSLEVPSVDKGMDQHELLPGLGTEPITLGKFGNT